MLDLNALTKIQLHSRRTGTPTLIPQTPRRGGCPTCGRKQLLSSKINNAIKKIMKP